MFKNWTKMIKNNEKSDQMDTENDQKLASLFSLFQKK